MSIGAQDGSHGARTTSLAGHDFLRGGCGWARHIRPLCAVMLLACAPLHFFALPEASAKIRSPGRQIESIRVAGCRRQWRVVALITAAVATHGFVTWGFQLVVIDLLPHFAVPGYLCGRLRIGHRFIQLSARLFRFPRRAILGRLDDGLVAAAIMPPALAGALALGARGGMVDRSLPRALWPFKRRHVRQPGDDAARFFSSAEYGAVVARLGLPPTCFRHRPPFFSFLLGEAATGGRWRLRFSVPRCIGQHGSALRMRPAQSGQPANSRHAPAIGGIDEAPRSFGGARTSHGLRKGTVAHRQATAANAACS